MTDHWRTLAALAALACIAGCAKAPEDGPLVVDEPSVRLEAELNLHFRDFSEVTLSDTYLERWLHKYHYLPGAKEMTSEEFFANLDLDRPSLKTVRTAVESGDMESAGAALMAHFQKRTAP